MRVVLLLIVLAIIGITLTQWLGKQSSNPAARQEAAQSDPLSPPAVPTRPQELKGFEKDMNKFMEDAAAQRARQLEGQEK